MAFRNALARLGAGGATVDTVLDLPEATPGGALSGTVHLTDGRVAQDVTEVRVSLEATVEVESGDGEWREDVTFGTAPIAGATVSSPVSGSRCRFGSPSRGSARSPQSTAGTCAGCAWACRRGSTSPVRSTRVTSTRSP